MPTRVGIVTHYWPPHLGGIEVLARDEALHLADRGWKVTVFTSRLRGDPQEVMDGAVRIRRFRCTNIPDERLGVPVPLMAPAMLRALLTSAHDLDVIVAHGHVYVGTLFALIAARVKRTPLVLVQHSPFVEYSNWLLNRMEHLADRTLGKAAFERADAVIAVSDFTSRFVKSITLSAKVIRIYPGVDLNRFQPPSNWRKGDRPLFVTVRRLVNRNGLDILIRAWLTWDVGRYANLAIAGDGPLRTELERMAGSASHVSFLGRVSDDDLLALYQSASVFVLPTLSGEGYGLALAEALAIGLPSIVTDSGAPPELVRNNANGLVVPPNDIDALGHAMSLMATDEHLRESLQRNVLATREELDCNRSLHLFETEIRRCVRARASDRTPKLLQQ